MSTITTSPATLDIDPIVVACLNASYVTATVETANSRYLLMKRSGWVTLVKVADTSGRSPIGINEPITGTDATVECSGMGYILRVWDSNRAATYGCTGLVFSSSWVQASAVLEN